MNGLNLAISCIVCDMLSKGRMKSDNNRNMLPTDIAPNVAVSSVLNIDPKKIPIRMNKLANKNNKSSMMCKLLNIGALNTLHAINKMSMLWSVIMIMFVIVNNRGSID